MKVRLNVRARLAAFLHPFIGHVKCCGRRRPMCTCVFPNREGLDY